MSTLLMLCSTTDGQTARICTRLQEQLQAQGQRVSLLMIEQAEAIDPRAFGRIVIGARIRYGHHDRRVLEFVRRHAAALREMPSAFFSVNVVARKPDKNRPDTNPYVRTFLRRTGWQPDLVGVFAGKLDYPRYGVLDRMIIRFIMLLTDGPTAPDTVCEFTDWKQVEDFGRRLAALDRPQPSPAGAAPARLAGHGASP